MKKLWKMIWKGRGKFMDSNLLNKFMKEQEQEEKQAKMQELND